ncbi:ABC-2 type transport system permease protein [Kibdelosporangium banguiense]|uniref:ABC-2 type transport system permease protein n=1 Tax=Kibdelosporangium banguiense TaxID=1365924 RepID=A0ABS4T9I0_9PSEU|nr:ABC transporter permease [Kibdelosporangium banguiense]MBP2321077.1 ABC-2 type transport system permease protein [Kibdelosporangium banguiense]
MIAYIRFEVLRVLHNPRYLVFLIVMPVAFALIWAKQGPGVMVAMAVYAACGGALLGSGNTIAEDRLTGWVRQLRVTPLPGRAWLGGKVVQGMLTVLPGLVAVGVVAVVKGQIPPGRWLEILVVMLVGSLPFVLVGVFVGLLVRGKTATVALMIVFFTLMFLGGVVGGETLWSWAPTHSLLDAGLNVLDGRTIGVTGLLNLGIWTVAAGVGVLFRVRRA